MSAFIVTDATIDAIVTAATIGDGLYVDGHRYHMDEADHIGQVLVDANRTSVNYRYREDFEPHEYRHRITSATRAPVEVLKAINCLEYQSCEVPDWPQSFAARVCDAVRRKSIAKLPGYDEAAWDLPERHPINA